MFRFNSGKIGRGDTDHAPAELVDLVQEAEDLIETDPLKGHDSFLKADDMYGTFRNHGFSFPRIEARLDLLFVDYQMRIDLGINHGT